MKHLQTFESYSSINEDIDWDKLFEPITKEEEALFKKEKDEEKKKEKDEHAKKIKATGKDWDEAVLKRIKSLKSEINKFIEDGKKGDISSPNDYDINELIDDLKELKYGADKYAENIKKIADKAFKKYLK